MTTFLDELSRDQLRALWARDVRRGVFTGSFETFRELMEEGRLEDELEENLIFVDSPDGLYLLP